MAQRQEEGRRSAALQFFYSRRRADAWRSKVAYPEQRPTKDISGQMAIEAGTRVTSATAHGKKGHSLISNAKFRQLYALALGMQKAGERERAVRGREAAVAGVAADLVERDVVVAEYAASVGDIARGNIARRMNRRSFEERVIEALSDAVGDRMRKTGRVTAIFFEGGGGSRILEEARALSIGAKLPVLLVEHARARVGRGSTGKRKARTPEYPSIPVDTQDVIAMYRVAHESIARARDNGGPTHIVEVSWKVEAKRGNRNADQAATRGATGHLEEWLRARGLPAEEWRREILTELGARERAQEMGAQERIESDAVEETEARAIA